MPQLYRENKKLFYFLHADVLHVRSIVVVVIVVVVVVVVVVVAVVVVGGLDQCWSSAWVALYNSPFIALLIKDMHCALYF